MIPDCQTVLNVIEIFVYFSLFKIYNSLYSIEQVLSLKPRSVTSWTKHAPYIKSIRVLCVQGTQSTFVNRVHVIYVSSAKTTMSKISKQKTIMLWHIVINFTYIQTETRSHASFSLFFKPVLLTDIKADVNTCIDNFSLYRSEMLTKAQRIIDLIEVVQNDFMNNLFSDFVIKHRCLKQKIELIRHLAYLQRYIQIYEQSSYSSKKYILFIKTARLPMLQYTHHALWLIHWTKRMWLYQREISVCWN